MALFKTGVVITGDNRGGVAAFRGTSAEADKLRGATDNVSASTRGYAAAVGKLKTAIAGLGLGLSIRELAQTEMQLASITRTLAVGVGDSERAGRAMDFVRSEAERLGLDVLGTARSLAQLQAAAKGTTLEGVGAAKVFRSVTEASTALGLSADQTEGALRAIEQMISKGNVQAEELRGQLGERLPGAFQLAAVAMGVTTEKLNDMLERGDVAATDLLPKLADVLENRFSKSAASAANELQQNTNRQITAFINLKAAANDAGIADAMNEGVKASTYLTQALTAVVGAQTQAFSGDPILDWASAWRAAVDQSVLFFGRIPDFVKSSAILIVNEVAYIAEATKLNFQAIGILGERAWQGIKDAAIFAMSGVLDAIENMALGAASVLDSLGADQLSGRLRDAASGLADFQDIIKRQSSENKARLDAERDAIVAAQGANKALRDSVIQQVLEQVAANEDARQAAVSAAGSIKKVGLEAFAAATGIGGYGSSADGASKEAEKLAKANQKLLESLRADALTESERALAQFEQRMSDLQGLLDAGLIGEGEFGDLSERFKTQYWDKFASGAEDAKKEIEAVDPFESLRDTLVDLSTDWGKATANIVSGIKTIQKANTGMFGDAAKGWGQVAAGASQYFDEGSGGYKVLQAASQAFYTFEIAQQAASAIASLTASEAKATGHATAAAAAGAEAVATQASAGPYVGFALAAAMVAFLASMGISPKGKGGGSASPSIPRGDINKGTGSVLGDANAKSESIANSLEQIESLQDRGLGVSQKMLLTLRSIDAGVRNTAAGLARNVYLTGTVTGQPVSGLGFEPLFSPGTFAMDVLGGDVLKDVFGGTIGEVLTFLDNFDFGGQLVTGLLDNLGSFKQIKDQGLLVSGAQTLAQVITDGLLANFYTTIRTGSNDIFGGDHNVRLSDVLSPLTDGLQSSFDQIVTGLGDAAIEAAEMLGITEQEVMAALAGVSLSQLGLNKISFNQLTGDDLEEAVGAVFSSIGDAMAEAILPAIIEFQRNGEGAFETLIRVASQTAYAQEAFESLGITLVSVGDSITQLQIAEAVQELSDLAGGFDALKDNLSAFVDFALTDAQKLDQLRGGLTDLFTEFGLTLPDTASGVLEVVQGLDLLTEEGRAAFTAITGASEALAAFYDELKRIERAAYDFDTAIGLNDGLGPMRDALTSVGLSLDQVTEAAQRFGVEGIQTLLGSLSDANKAILEPLIGDILQQVLGASSVGDYEAQQAQAARDAVQEMREAVRGVMDFADSLKASIISLNSPEQNLQRLQYAFSGAVTRAGSDNRNTRLSGLRDIATYGPDLEAAIIGSATSAVDAQRQLAQLRADSLDAAYSTLDIGERQLDALRGVQGTVAKSIESARENSRNQVQAINHVTAVLSQQGEERRTNTESNAQLQARIDTLNKNVEMLRFEMQATAKSSATTAKVLSRAMQDGQSLNVTTPT